MKLPKLQFVYANRGGRGGSDLCRTRGNRGWEVREHQEGRLTHNVQWLDRLETVRKLRNADEVVRVAFRVRAGRLIYIKIPVVVHNKFVLVGTWE